MSGGILIALVQFVATLLCVWTGYAAGYLEVVSSVYPGYSISYVGSIIGLIYGFIDGFIGFGLFGLIYSKLGDDSSKCCK